MEGQLCGRIMMGLVTPQQVSKFSSTVAGGVGGSAVTPPVGHDVIVSGGDGEEGDGEADSRILGEAGVGGVARVTSAVPDGRRLYRRLPVPALSAAQLQLLREADALCR